MWVKGKRYLLQLMPLVTKLPSPTPKLKGDWAERGRRILVAYVLYAIHSDVIMT